MKSFTNNSTLSAYNLRKQRENRRGERLNVLLVGENGIGLKSFINTISLTQVNAQPPDYTINTPHGNDHQFKLVTNFTDIVDSDTVPLKLRITSTVNYGHELQTTHIPDKIANYIEQQLKRVLDEELKIHRNPRFEDTRIHVAFMFIRATGRGLSQLDLATMKRIGSLVNIIPILSKADTLTIEEINLNKRLIQNDIKQHNILVYQFSPTTSIKEKFQDDEPELIPDRDELDYVVTLQRSVPFTVINRCESSKSTDLLEAIRNTRWGLIPIGDSNLCDLSMLRNCLLTSHLRELKDITVQELYESYRELQLTEHVPENTAKGSEIGNCRPSSVFGNNTLNSLAE